jgi:NADH:ubiquinone reductase (H+-translocating)
MGTATNMSRHVLIVGGGYVGMYTALRLRKKLRRSIRSGELEITLVSPQSYMTYQPFLPEAAAGNLEPRHVVVSLRRILPGVKILNGRVTGIEHAKSQATVQIVESGDPEPRETRTLSYDYLVFCPGSISRTLPIPGLAAYGVGFKTVAEAIFLRNHVLRQLDIAASTTDPEARKQALTFVFVGGGYAGVEALAELEDMARDALDSYPMLRAEEMHWVLVEASDRILPEVGADMGKWTVEALRGRGIDVRLKTLLKSAENRRIVLSDGDEFSAGTLVWTAGVKPNPLVKKTDLPLDEKDRVKATAELTVDGVDNAFTAGDIAAVPDLTKPGEFCAPNAQHAVRQAKVLGDNVVASLRGREPKAYKHAYAGSVASLGLHKGVAQVYGIKLRGLLAWIMHRTYHLSRLPTVNRKARVTADWSLALFFKREVVSLGTLERPREEFELATKKY